MAKIIAKSSIDRILATADLVHIASDYLDLKKQGQDSFWACCPFHNEKTASFKISASQKFYYCFGCQASGDAISFIQNIERLDFPGACEFLANKLGLDLEYDDGRPDPELARKKLYKLMHLEAARYFYLALQSKLGQEARDYLTLKRGLSPHIIKKFGLGFAPNEYQGLYNHLRSKNFQAADIVAAGLAKQGKDGPIDLFRNRIIFPIFDSVSSIIAFGGRVLDDSLPKYLNSPESKLFSKGRELYAYNFAKQSPKLRAPAGPIELQESKDLPQLILCEGYLDVLALNQAGFDNAVAGLGTALTDQQVKYIQSISPRLEVLLCYDGDFAGQKAAFKAMQKFLDSGTEPKILPLPKELDPDDYLKKYGRERFKELLKDALRPLDFILEILRKNHTDEDGSLDEFAYNRAGVQAIAKYETEANLDLRIQAFARELRVREDGIRRQVMQQRSKDLNRTKPRQQSSRGKQQAGESDYLVLYALIFKFLKVDDFQSIFGRRFEAAGVNDFLFSILEEYSGCKLLSEIQDERVKEAVFAQIEALKPVQLLARAREIVLDEEENLEQRILAAGEEAERTEGSSLKLIARVKKMLDTLEKEEIRQARSSIIGEALTSHDEGDLQKRNRDLKRLQEIDLAKLSRKNTEDNSHSNN